MTPAQARRIVEALILAHHTTKDQAAALRLILDQMDVAHRALRLLGGQRGAK